jgi:hypothetical protein
LLRQGFFAWQDGKNYHSWGFILTPKAYDIAAQHQIAIKAETAIALFVGFNTTSERWQPDWMGNDYQRFVDRLAHSEAKEKKQ